MNRICRIGRWICLVLVLFWGLPGLAFSQRLEIAVEDDAAPWSNKNGTGYANDVVQAAFSAVGQDIKLLVTPYARAKEMVISGKVVAAFTMSREPDLEKKILFPNTPLFTCHSDFFTRHNHTAKFKSEKELPVGTVIGVVIGYEYPPSIYDLRKKGILVFEASESEETNFKKLVHGRIDYALVDYNDQKPFELLIEKAGVAGKVIKAFRCGTMNCYIGFSAVHKQGKQALAKFNEGMRIISRNGTLKKLDKKWEDIALSELDKLRANKK